MFLRKQKIVICIFMLFLGSFNLVKAHGLNDVALEQAIKSNDIPAIHSALSMGANPSGRYNEGRGIPFIEGVVASLYLSNSKNRDRTFEVLKLLVDAGALKSKSGKVLWLPVAQGDLEVLEYLISNGANVNEVIDGDRLVEVALMNSQQGAYDVLVAAGASPASLNKKILTKRLNNALIGADLLKVKEILDQGADLNPGNEIMRKPLTVVLSYPLDDDGLSKFEYLLSNGADPNLEGETFLITGTPLSVAVMHGSFVLQKGSLNKNSKLHGNYILAIKSLLRNGARVSGTSGDGNTPLHIAAKMNFIEAAKILLKEGAKVMPKNKLGKTPLDLAESKEMILILKKNGAREQP